MPSTQVTLVPATVALVPLDAPTGRVVLTVEAGTAAEIYVTADGSLPIVPVGGVEIPGGQVNIPAMVGYQAIIQPPLTAGYMQLATLRLLSAGAPVVTISW